MAKNKKWSSVAKFEIALQAILIVLLMSFFGFIVYNQMIRSWLY